MRTLLVGDVHGCADALDRLLRDARPDRLILLGDIFAKGPDPAGVWRLILRHRAEAVLGNHDQRLLECWGREGDKPHHRCWPLLDDACRSWISRLPLMIHGTCLPPGHAPVPRRPWLAVHAGVNPETGFVGTTRAQALVLRRWPDDSDRSNPFWWERYRGRERVFYGHDAMRGVQIHPDSVGLDSGCVYGNALSGWLLEEDRLVQVRASTG